MFIGAAIISPDTKLAKGTGAVSPYNDYRSQKTINVHWIIKVSSGAFPGATSGRIPTKEHNLQKP